VYPSVRFILFTSVFASDRIKRKRSSGTGTPEGFFSEIRLTHDLLQGRFPLQGAERSRRERKGDVFLRCARYTGKEPLAGDFSADTLSVAKRGNPTAHKSVHRGLQNRVFKATLRALSELWNAGGADGTLRDIHLGMKRLEAHESHE
jgi:hypothetical protein